MKKERLGVLFLFYRDIFGSVFLLSFAKK